VCHPLHSLNDFLDPLFQSSTRPIDQKKWLAEKFELYKEHHNNKTLGQFFPPLYEEYFSSWPPAPTAQDIGAANGNIAVAISAIRKVEEHVRDFEFTPAVSVLIKVMISDFTDGCSTAAGRNTV